MTNQDDAFMRALRRDADPAFVGALKARLDHAPARHFAARRALKLALIAAIALLLVVIASPETRAQIAQRVEQLFYGEVELRVVPRVSGGHEGGVSNAPVKLVSADEAQAVYAHKLPTWTPDGFTREADVHVVYYSADDIYMGYKWDAGDDQRLVLSIMNTGTPQIVIGQNNHAEEIHVNDQTGTLYSGSWDDQGFFNGDQLNLVWVDGDLTYFLSSAGISQDDLIRIAESFQ